MQSQGGLSEVDLKDRVKNFAEARWDGLPERQKNYSRKIWGVLTYKWRWQIAINIPYLVIFILDRTIPSVHQFDMAVLSTLTSRLPIPAFISSWLGVG